MEHNNAYTIIGSPPYTQPGTPRRLSTSPSIKREPKAGGDNLRILYRNSTSSGDDASVQPKIEHDITGPESTALPPTPPNVEDDAQESNIDEHLSTSETNKIRSELVAPVNQNSPPTPDLTPPRSRNAKSRPFLGPQPSMASTRAESFKTAREDIQSDAESDVSLPLQRHDFFYSSHALSQLRMVSGHKPSPLGQTLALAIVETQSTASSPTVTFPAWISSPDNATKLRDSHLIEHFFEESPTIPQNGFKFILPSRRAVKSYSQRVVSAPDEIPVSSRKEIDRRGTSLRERLQDSRNVPRSPSVDKFASIIGWNDGVQQQDNGNKRWSVVSTTSTVEAFVVEKPEFAKNRGTLRHIAKHDSLRSASSPFPTSDRTSAQTMSDSPHRLVHKKARLSNVNRYSFGSDVSRPISLSSNMPVSKPEVIKVAVIPERGSSLQGSTVSSRRHSAATSAFSIPPHTRQGSDSTSIAGRKRTMSEAADRGRGRYYPPQAPPHIPTRASSLSAPTSRNTSRANSITSEIYAAERKKAEDDLRTTLERMESDTLTVSLKSLSVGSTSRPTTHLMVTVPRSEHGRRHPSLSGSAKLERVTSSQSEIRAHDFALNVESNPEHIVPGTKEWADLRPSSVPHTPFSQPSFMSASPEINEAKAINLFPHNNYSVQLIEPAVSLEDSRAVQEVRSGDIDGLSALPQRYDSPLRNPRRPPKPPRFQLFPPIPQKENGKQSSFTNTSPAKRPEPPHQRPSLHARARTDSFGRSLLHTVSLKNTQNKKADQNLDAKQNPFWRPRAFWDYYEIEPASTQQQDVQEGGTIQNSLGLPSQKSAITGPVGLMHRISERRRHRKQLAKQSSYSSLQRIRAGRKLYKIPGLGVQLQFVSLKDIQNHFTRNRQVKEEQKRQKRQETLRKSIGPNVIPESDSRFPAVMMTSNTSVTVNNAFLSLP